MTVQLNVTIKWVPDEDEDEGGGRKHTKKRKKKQMKNSAGVVIPPGVFIVTCLVRLCCAYENKKIDIVRF